MNRTLFALIAGVAIAFGSAAVAEMIDTVSYTHLGKFVRSAYKGAFELEALDVVSRA